MSDKSKINELFPQKREFETMLEESRVTTFRVQDYFRKQGYNVIDRQDDVISQSIGISFEIYDPKRWMFRVVVKSDNKVHTTGNLFIEHKMERSTKTAKGWMHYCLADILCYHDTVNDCGYLIWWRQMREEASGFPLVEFRNPYDYATMGYGYLVPIEEAKERGLIFHTYTLKTN